MALRPLLAVPLVDVEEDEAAAEVSLHKLRLANLRNRLRLRRSRQSRQTHRPHLRRAPPAVAAEAVVEGERRPHAVSRIGPAMQRIRRESS
jgi:hypothetical protein